MIKKFYYSVWTDCILQLQKNPLNKKSWKWYSLFVMSSCLGFNFVFILTILPRSLHLTDFFRETTFFESKFLDTFTHALILYLLPEYIINYFLVFYKNKYTVFIKKYKFHNGKLFIRYAAISLLAPPLILMVVLIIYKLI